MKLTRPETDTAYFANALLVCGGLCLFAASADAQEQSDLRFYGAINQALMDYDDGLDKLNYGRVDNAVEDNVNRLGVQFDRALSSGWDMTGTVEIGFAPKPSNQVSQLDPDNSGWKFDETSIRKFELAFARPGVGTFYFGQGDMSGQSSAPDFSGTTVIASSNPAELAGGNFWRLASTGVMTTRQIDESFSNFDSGRRMRIRYDTPEMYGIRLSTSVGREVLVSGDNSTYIDATALYGKQWKNVDLAIELAAKGLGQDEYAGGGGFAVIHKPSGLNFAWSTMRTTNEVHYGVSKIGLKRDLFSFGSTAISYDNYNGGSFVRYGTESISEGISIVQTIDSLNIDLYVTARSYEGYTNIGLPDEHFLTSTATALGINWTF